MSEAALDLSELEAELELSRVESELSLTEFIKHGWKWVDPAVYVHGRHTDLISTHLEAMVKGILRPDEVAKLLINIPPGHQKSLTVCVFWPAWCWGPLNRPDLRFMFTSYRGDLALRDADRSRQLIKSPWYQECWGDRFQLIRSQDSKGRFGNDQGGYRFSTSMKGIMGEGGDFVVLDDPHNVDQAESADVRKELIRRIDLALPTRIRNPTGGVVVIMQRLHEQDYSGHVLVNEPGEWDHLCLPAEFEADSETGENIHPFPINTRLIDPETGEPYRDWRTKPGELLFPELFGGGRIDQIKTPLGVYGTAGQLQQRPTPREGSMFKREWLERNVIEPEMVPALRKLVRAWDFASVKDGGDFTADVKGGLAADGTVYFTECSEIQEASATVRKTWERKTKADTTRCVCRIPQDPGQAGKDQAEQYLGALPGYPVRAVRPTGDKETRAEPMSSAFQIDKIKIVRGPWNDTLIERLSGFPAPGSPDDVVDAASDCYNELTLGANFASGQKVMQG
jgi:predicted phage terminase large subunit-like protein